MLDLNHNSSYHGEELGKHFLGGGVKRLTV